VFDTGKAAEIRADLGEQLHDAGDGQAVDAREIDAGPIGQDLTRLELCAQLAAGARRRTDINLGLPELGHQRLQLGIALNQVPCNVVVHRQRLAQHEQVFIAPVAVSARAMSA